MRGSYGRLETCPPGERGTLMPSGLADGNLEAPWKVRSGVSNSPSTGPYGNCGCLSFPLRAPFVGEGVLLLLPMGRGGFISSPMVVRVALGPLPYSY